MLELEHALGTRLSMLMVSLVRQVAGLNSRLVSLEGIMPDSDQKESQLAGATPPGLLSPGNSPQVGEHPLQPSVRAMHYCLC